MPRYAIPRPTDHAPIPGSHDVAFRAVADGDVPDMWRWAHDPEVIEFWGPPPADVAALRDLVMDPGDQPTWRFIIELAARSVGFIQYHHPHADPASFWSAGIDIYIGEPDARNRGVGTEAVRTMLAYLFEVQHVHRVTIDPQTTNARAIRCYEHAGFHRDGVLRHHDRMHGRYVDTQFMTILEDEWPAARATWDAERGAAR